MSLEGNRCANCGAKMRLVNVTRINTFRTPEASQYDLSLSHRKAGGIVQSSSREYLCNCCGYRIPAEAAKAVKIAKEKKVKEKKEKVKKQTTPEAAEKKKERIIGWIKFFIFLAVVAVCAYFAYKYRDTITNYYHQFMDLLGKVKELIDKIRS